VADPYTHRLIEPKLRLSESIGRPTVALTFDACMGTIDERIFSTLINYRIPSTVFVTARWVKHNAAAVAVMRAHPQLFEIENHGAKHIPAVDYATRIYGIQTAGSQNAVVQEVEGGSDAIVSTGAPKPKFFRGATAKYTQSAMRQIEEMGYTIAGYSLNGDAGSLLDRTGTERRFKSAKNGDVIIAHINQPTRHAGEGVVAGILDLQQRGYQFVLFRNRPELLDRAAR